MFGNPPLLGGFSCEFSNSLCIYTSSPCLQFPLCFPLAPSEFAFNNRQFRYFLFPLFFSNVKDLSRLYTLAAPANFPPPFPLGHRGSRNYFFFLPPFAETLGVSFALIDRGSLKNLQFFEDRGCSSRRFRYAFFPRATDWA